MLLLQCHHHFSSIPFLFHYHHLPHKHPPLLSSPPSLRFPHKTISLSPYPFSTQPGPGTCRAQLEEEGPVELPASESIFATNDDPSTLQVATSVLLTGAISVFLFRSLRRRAKRAKELKFRSTGVKKSLKEEAMENLKAMTPTSVDDGKSPPSAVQALLGGLSAAVIALILYKFTTTIEASLNRQTLSDNFSVRQITITIRTIINGLCYLATFVFGINAVGLVLYSGQLALNSLMEDDSTSEETGTKDDPSSLNLISSDSPEENNRSGDQKSEGMQ